MRVAEPEVEHEDEHEEGGRLGAEDLVEISSRSPEISSRSPEEEEIAEMVLARSSSSRRSRSRHRSP
tara:strand:+ start:116 stop:316 length:201 start_codon:yes stop_codon:yes gene_type:complete